MLSVAGVVATNPIPHFSLLGSVAQPTQHLTAPHAVPGYLVNRAPHAAPGHSGGTLPVAAGTHHRAVTLASTSTHHPAHAKAGVSAYNGQNPFAKTPKVHAAAITTTDPAAGMMPAAATDPSAADPSPVSNSSMACMPGDTATVDVLVATIPNNTSRDLHWEYKYSTSQEIGSCPTPV